jgi:hypothetical protein
MSSYDLAWFIPSAAERRQGAKWLRCDLVLTGGKQLQPLPTDGSAFLSAPPLSDSVARCLTGKGTDTVCAKTHAWRAKGAVRLAGKSYPGEKRIAKVAARKCEGITGTRSWRWTSPSAVTWKHADRMLVCYAKTRK